MTSRMLWLFLCIIGWILIFSYLLYDVTLFIIMGGALVIVAIGGFTILNIRDHRLPREWVELQRYPLVPIPGTGGKYYLMPSAEEDPEFYIFTYGKRNANEGILLGRQGIRGMRSVTINTIPDNQAELVYYQQVPINRNDFWIGDRHILFDIGVEFRIPEGGILHDLQTK